MFGNDPASTHFFTQTVQVILSPHGFHVYWLCQIFCTCREFVETANAEWQTVERDSCHIHRCCNRLSFIAAAVGLNFINRPVILLCTHTKKNKKKTSQILVPVALLWCKNKQRNMSVSEADSCFATPVEYLDQTLLWNITPQINRYLYFFLSFSFSLVPQLLHNTSNKPSDISHKEDNWIMGM